MKIFNIQFSIFNFILDILFPRFCIGCNREGIDFCKDCLQNLRPHTAVRRDGWNVLDGVVTLAPYGDPVVRNLIQTWKYDRVMNLSEPIAAFIRHGVANLGPLLDADVVIPIPLHWYRERERGFNQAKIIAEAIAGAFGRPVGETLTRRRRTSAQSKLPHGSTDREKNVEAAFGIADSPSVLGKRCLLVDDVVTSGKTMDACAAVLRDAGASSVWGFAIARG